MPPPQALSSPKNPRIKALVKLMAESAERRETGTFVLEGTREITRALGYGFIPREAYSVPELYEKNSEATAAVLAMLIQARIKPTSITKEMFSKVALREGRDGLLVVFEHKKPLEPEQLLAKAKSASPFFLALQGLEKPGNIGALLRSADGAGVDGVLVIQNQQSPVFDRYHPQTLRNSLGAAFSLDFASITPEDFGGFCKKHHLQAVAAALSPQAVSLYQAPLHGSLVLMLGSEAQGLDQSLITSADQTIKIPMRGICDSLNVAAAGAVILYEIQRQRDAKGKD